MNSVFYRSYVGLSLCILVFKIKRGPQLLALYLPTGLKTFFSYDLQKTLHCRCWSLDTSPIQLEVKTISGTSILLFAHKWWCGKLLLTFFYLWKLRRAYLPTPTLVEVGCILANHSIYIHRERHKYLILFLN